MDNQIPPLLPRRDGVRRPACGLGVHCGHIPRLPQPQPATVLHDAPVGEQHQRQGEHPDTDELLCETSVAGDLRAQRTDDENEQAVGGEAGGDRNPGRSQADHARPVGAIPAQEQETAETPQGFTGGAHARASGKLLLAHALAAVTPATITDRDRLDREFTRIREQGYAVDNEEFAPGLCCLAVPLHAGHSPFVLALSAPKERFERHFDANLAVMRRIAGTGR